jgi:methyl-accepting chemotaxis protein
MSLTTKFLEQQTKFFEQQTKLIEQQTKMIEQQTKLIEQQTKMIEEQSKMLEKASKRDEKVAWETQARMNKMQDLGKNAEMRQCQTSGEGTDACRMADCYVRGQSASISRTTETARVKYVIERCSGEGLRYRDVFSKKDSGGSIK